MIGTTLRNADLADLADLLRDQHARKVDVVAPADAIRSIEGIIAVDGTDAVIDDAGVTPTTGHYRPTDVFDDGVSEKLGIPRAYLRRLRSERPDLYDANVNGLLHGRNRKIRYGSDVGRNGERRDPEVLREAIPGDGRSFLVRAFKGDDGTGIARALLSNSYGIQDNLDVLTAALEGVRRAGVDVEIDSCDLTERRMQVRVVAPAVQALAPVLLDGYRSPFGHGGIERVRELADREGMGYGDGGEPILFAGFVLSNSETGGGAFTITPRLVVQICRNGLTMTADAVRQVHLGSKMDDGVIRWSDETRERNLALVTSKAADSVATFLDVDYMTKVIERLSEKAGKPVSSGAVELVGKRLAFTDATTRGVLDHFIAGGQLTAGGIMAAITSFAQTVDDADLAWDLEEAAIRGLEAAYAVA